MIKEGVNMSISLSYNNVSDYQNFNHLQIVFTNTPSKKLLNKFANALNANGHLPYTIKLDQLLHVPYLQIAHTHDGEFIGGCSIKHCDGELAEVGLMLVDKKYRRLGLAEYMTQSRISYAQYLGAKMLYAKVREKNIKSMNNLHKAGFRSAGNFLSQKDLYSTITWLYLPLKPMPHYECCQRLRKKLVNLVSVIG